MNMKKFMAILLTLSLMLGLSVNAVATDVNLDAVGESSTQDVTIKVVHGDGQGGAAGTVYAVTITWDSLDFTYTTGPWNPSDNQYDEGSWSNAATVKIVNSSNAGIAYTATYNKLDAEMNTLDQYEVSINLSKNSGTIGAAANGSSQQDSFTVRPQGRPDNDNIPNAVKIGAIVVAISAAA